MTTPIAVERTTLEQAAVAHSHIPEFDPTYIADNINRPDLAILDKNPYIIVAKVGEVLAGYMIGYDRDDVPNTMHIWLNGTDPSYRGQGVFGALLGNLADEARSRGHDQLTVKSNSDHFPNMIGALAAHGFEITEQNGDSVRYQKSL